MKKIWTLFFASAAALSLEASTWIHGNIEYIHGLPQSEMEYAGKSGGNPVSGIESEVFHNVPYLPNLKFDMFRAPGFHQTNKTLYYSAYYNNVHFDFGGTSRDIEYKDDSRTFNMLTMRIGTFANARVFGGLTYSYELDGQVKEYIVDVNYVVSKKFPMTVGFQYKSSQMELNQGYSLEGIFLKAGFRF